MDAETVKIIARAKKLGIVNPTAVRNLHIKAEFKQLREKKVKYEDALAQLADKYFLGVASIEKIILRK